MASLLFLLFSCDSSVTALMKKMGNNIIGVDSEEVTSAVESINVKEGEIKSEKKSSVKPLIDNVETAVDATSFSYLEAGEEVELFTVGKRTEYNDNIIGIGKVFVVLASEDVDLSSVTSVLPPRSLDEITSTLSGNGKSEMIRKFGEKISDEATRSAADGTKKVIQAILETFVSNDEKDDDKTGKKILNSVISNMKSKTADDLTTGDLIVLQTVTNVIAGASSSVMELLKGNIDKMSSLMNTAYDSIVSTAVIFNSLDGTSTILGDVDLTGLLGSLIK